MTLRFRIACVSCVLLFSSSGHADGRLQLLDGSPPARHVRPVTFRTELPGWRALVDTDTGVPLRLYGRGLAAPQAIASPRAAERLARAALADHLSLLAPGNALADFRLTANHLARGVRTVAFTHRTVLGSQVSFRFVRDRLVAIASEAIPIHEHLVAATYLPIIRRGAVELRAVRVAPRAPHATHRIYLDASTGRPIARQPLWHSGQGTLLYDTPVRYPEGGRAPFPARFADVTADGTPTTTDTDGQVTWASDTTAAIATTATGTYVVVTSADDADATATLALDPGGSVTWSDETPAIDAQLTAFVHANRAKTFVRTLAP
ncbi:MAG TPA: hypothetical protein VMZ28_04805, partial [Kofleriaceae bacterium]|nr:hypothetical protein [Kofleriaceae bacterium]